MKRALLLLTSLLLLAAEGGFSQARPLDGPDQAPPSAAPATPAPPAHDPLEEFVPHDKLDADSVVALPVDILMARRLPGSREFVFQVLALLGSVVLVHSLYVTVVWPRAEAALAANQAHMQVDPNYVEERSIWVILRDYEQESEIVLMLWALAIIGQKVVLLRRERTLFGRELVFLGEGMRILPDDAREHARHVEALPEDQREFLLPRTLLSVLNRFGATGGIADASSAARGVIDGEADRLDSELSLLRYIAWAIPAIGFIGTVRGIGDALAQAHRAMQGDLSGVTQGLGTAFNSTLIALLLSLVLMFLLHHLQSEQDQLVREADSYVDRRLLQSLRAA